MRFSESLRRNIMKSSVGGIVNKLGGKSRRTTLFFEDILAQYIKECEDAGYGNKTEKIGETWASLATKQLSMLSIFQSIDLLNYAARRVWNCIGLMDDFELIKEDKRILVKTKNEFITRTIGENQFMAGFFAGCLESYFGKKVKLTNMKIDKLESEYSFEITEDSCTINRKDKRTYDKLNEIPISDGFSLKNALESKMVILKGNRMYFRNKPIITIENTVFHLIGNEKIAIEKVPQISYSFFREIVEKEASSEKKLTLLKNLLQIMGWCTANISVKSDDIEMKLKHLPVGFQTETNNWIFIVEVIKGYLWQINKKIDVKRILQKENELYIVFGTKKK